MKSSNVAKHPREDREFATVWPLLQDDAAPSASPTYSKTPSSAWCSSTTSAPRAWVDYTHFVICLSPIGRDNQRTSPSRVTSALFGYNNPHYHRAQVLHNTSTGNLGMPTTFLFLPTNSNSRKSKHAISRLKDNLRNEIKERQMEEARAFKAEKIKNRQPINEKTFEEFKAVVGPKVTFMPAGWPCILNKPIPFRRC